MKFTNPLFCWPATLLMSGTVTAHAALNSQLQASATAARADVLKTLEQLVNIDSGTGNERGVNQVGDLIADELRKLGARIEFHSAAPAAGKNVVATLKGSGKGKILLIAHLDTVFADGTVAARRFRVDGKRAYGPGVADDKGGAVLALYSLKLLQQLQVRRVLTNHFGPEHQ